MPDDPHANRELTQRLIFAMIVLALIATQAVPLAARLWVWLRGPIEAPAPAPVWPPPGQA